MTGRTPRPLFLDRDGVINADSPDFIRSVADWAPLPGSLEAIARATRAGFAVVVVTNQSGIARGLYSEADLETIHAEMHRRVEGLGGRLAGIFHCPHAPGAGCSCRKPEPGLIERACRTLGLEAKGAPLIGDRESDLEAARRAGCRPILVRREDAAGARLAVNDSSAVAVHPDLASAVDALIAAMPDVGA